MRRPSSENAQSSKSSSKVSHSKESTSARLKSPQLKFNILTLFPDVFRPFLDQSIMGRASSQGLVEFNLVQIRDFAENKYRTVDEPPFGGGEGMVMKADVCAAALKSVLPKKSTESKVIFVSPQGKLFNQKMAKELVENSKELTLICGHYEGIDERFIEKYVDLEISIGDYVLTGGELPAMVMIDALTRILPGAVGNERSISHETFENGLLKYPQYTRPREFEGVEVPEVLLSGNHKLIDQWRYEKMCERTKVRRPDLWKNFLKTRAQK